MIDANLALNHLTNSANGQNRIRAMIGASQLSATDQTVGFKFMRGASNKSNYLKLTITSDDLYKMEFIRIYGMKVITIKEVDGLFFDQLKELFEAETKLALSL